MSDQGSERAKEVLGQWFPNRPIAIHDDGGPFVHIGSGHRIRVMFMYQGDGTPIGLIEEHNKPDGSNCEGIIHFKSHSPEHGWEIVGELPLSLDPSLLCTICQDHGWIRDGRWVPA